jgi:hypothetical protein
MNDFNNYLWVMVSLYYKELYCKYFLVIENIKFEVD